MKIKDLSHYVKFIFSGDNGDCYSTTDVEILKYIINKGTGEPIYSISIGDVIFFEPNENNNFFEIVNIKIRHLADDTEILKYGIDMQDCTGFQGEAKPWMFSILCEMRLL